MEQRIARNPIMETKRTFWNLLLVAAMLMTSLSMVQGRAAQASTVDAALPDHCAMMQAEQDIATGDRQTPAKSHGPTMDCAMTCAVVLPSVPQVGAAHADRQANLSAAPVSPLPGQWRFLDTPPPKA